jgi:hypothetical protein
MGTLARTISADMGVRWLLPGLPGPRLAEGDVLDESNVLARDPNDGACGSRTE